MERKMDKIQRIFGFDNELFSIRREKFRMKNANNPIYAIVSYFGTYFPAKLIIPPHRGRLNNAIFVKLRISLRKETKLVSDSILRIFADCRRLRDGENAITRCNGKYRRCVGSRYGYTVGGGIGGRCWSVSRVPRRIRVERSYETAVYRGGR